MDAINIGIDENLVQADGIRENIIEIEIPYPLFQYLSSEECNLQKICRICLSVNDQVLHPLYSTNENNVLANIVIALTEIQMSSEDGLPPNICPRCQSEVINYYEFKEKCVNSDYTLKSVFKGEFVTKEELIAHNNNEKLKTDLENVTNDIKEIENEVKPEVDKDTEYTEFDYLEDLKYSMSDDEALCIVRDTKSDEKQITIVDNVSDSNNLFKDVVKQKETKTSSKKLKHRCSLCPKKFHKIKSLRTHMKKHHAAQVSECPFPCGQCKEAFNSEFDLGLHGMLHNQDNGWKCTECQKEFKGKQALRRHVQRHMQSKRFSCAACGKCFVEQYALRRHARVHTGQRPEKKHVCAVCDKRFADVSSLVAHGARHGGARGCVCACGAAFPTPRLLASHARVHAQDKPYACTHCGKRFRHESTRNTHHRTHTGERPYVCAQCGKAFIQKSNMTLHMRTHTGEKPYACGECARRFSSGSTLKAHRRTHTGERPYACKLCGKKFARLNLKQHMSLHTGERPHGCRACHKRFNSAARLREHYRLHTGEKPFECASCTRKFTTKGQLARHVKKHEKKKKANKKGRVMLIPVTISDKNVLSAPNIQPKTNQDKFMYVNINPAPLVASVPSQANLCTVQETTMPPNAQELLYQDNGGTNMEVIVLGDDQNLASNSGINDVTNMNDVNLVTVNEGEVSISAASATMEGTTVKLYQYDQSLVQIHTGGGQLTISRISSKMTTNF